MISNKLKCCPVCGETPTLSTSLGVFSVECKNKDCKCTVKTIGTSESEVLKAWNRRSNAELSELEDSVAEYYVRKIKGKSK